MTINVEEKIARLDPVKRRKVEERAAGLSPKRKRSASWVTAGSVTATLPAGNPAGCANETWVTLWTGHMGNSFDEMAGIDREVDRCPGKRGTPWN